MEDSFNVRVGRTFGALSTTSSSNSKELSSLWSLTDEEIQRQEWNRGKESPQAEAAPRPFFSNQFLTELRRKKLLDSREELERDLDDLEDDDLDEDARRPRDASSSGAEKPEDFNDEEWEIKSNIGKDCSLDKEEEEDHYDKVAVGRDDGGDKLYLKDINDYETDADVFGELPTSFRDVERDPRANLIAARLRLKEDEEATKKRLQEDAEAARKMDSLRVSEDNAPNGADVDTMAPDDGNLKSILKKRDNESDVRSHKRVRFDAECKIDDDDDDDDEGHDRSKDLAMEGTSALPQEDIPSRVPDYMRNPSKYTHYTFDSSDMDDESNRQGYMDFLNLMKKSKNVEPEEETDLKSITFIPRRKVADTTMVDSGTESAENKQDSHKYSSQPRGLSIGISATDSEDGDNAMEEDEPLKAAYRNNSNKTGRKYRVKLKANEQFDD